MHELVNGAQVFHHHYAHFRIFMHTGRDGNKKSKLDARPFTSPKGPMTPPLQAGIFLTHEQPMVPTFTSLYREDKVHHTMGNTRPEG
jgi:hypothetical protein